MHELSFEEKNVAWGERGANGVTRIASRRNRRLVEHADKVRTGNNLKRAIFGHLCGSCGSLPDLGCAREAGSGKLTM